MKNQAIEISRAIKYQGKELKNVNIRVHSTFSHKYAKTFETRSYYYMSVYQINRFHSYMRIEVPECCYTNR